MYQEHVWLRRLRRVAYLLICIPAISYQTIVFLNPNVILSIDVFSKVTLVSPNLQQAARLRNSIVHFWDVVLSNYTC